MHFHSLSHNNISSKGASLLFDAIRERKIKIKSLLLGENDLSDDCMMSLGKLLNDNQSIEKVDISGHSDQEGGVTDYGIAALQNEMKTGTSLRCLNIANYRKITDSSSSDILKIIELSNLDEDIYHRAPISTMRNEIHIAISINKIKNGNEHIRISLG